MGYRKKIARKKSLLFLFSHIERGRGCLYASRRDESFEPTKQSRFFNIVSIKLRSVPNAFTILQDIENAFLKIDQNTNSTLSPGSLSARWNEECCSKIYWCGIGFPLGPAHENMLYVLFSKSMFLCETQKECIDVLSEVALSLSC